MDPLTVFRRCIIHGIIEWSTLLSAAYESMVRQLEHHHHAYINPYAATSPASFLRYQRVFFLRARNSAYALWRRLPATTALLPAKSTVSSAFYLLKVLADLWKSGE